LKELCLNLSKKLQNEKLVARTFQLTIKTNDFKSATRSITISDKFNDFKTISELAIMLFEKNHLGKTLRLVGVSVHNLGPLLEEFEQMSLFSNQEEEEKNSVRLLIKEMNVKLKKDLLFRASDLKMIKPK
jgi:DNA polymerase-4